jgi:hypothetical protein
MLLGALLGAPKYRDLYVTTPAMAAGFTLVHPCPGAATWTITNAAAGSVTGDVYTPAVDFYGICHIVGKVGDVRVLVNVWVVPNNTPKYTYNLPQLRLFKSDADVNRNNGVAPRPGAIDWDLNTDRLNLGWDPSAWGTPVQKTFTTLTYNFGTHRVNATVSGGAADHRWYLLERLAGTVRYIDRTSGATVVSGGTSNTVVFQHPNLTSNLWVPMAGDQWDCWIMPLP